jgi:thiosulfate/3-mercaptopyruvate sulfurtransferase
VALTTDSVPEDYASADVLVDTDWVKAHADDSDVRLLDVSGDLEAFEEGHIPHAQYLNVSESLTNSSASVRGQIATAEGLEEALSELGVENDHTVVLYDNRSNLWAARAYWVLKYYQHEDVRIYNGGTIKWLDEGEELTRRTPRFDESDYEAAEADPSIRTTWKDVVASVDDTSALFCDTRSLQEHLGVDARAERGGHIPGSIRVEWTEAVNNDGTFLEAENLYRLYRSAGFAPEQTIVTYCQTGVRGAHTWFVLHKLLGYPDVRNYDGSWEEYGNNPDSPLQ